MWIDDAIIGAEARNAQVDLGSVDMTSTIDDLLPKAEDALLKVAETEAAKGDAGRKALAAAEAGKKALIDQLSKPTGLSEDERIKLASNVIQRAINNGLTEVQVYRFPNAMCSDFGRAINQAEPGWENTLTGVPKEIYQLWCDYLRPRGYKLRFQVLEFPGGMPGDIGVTLSWH
jgi:hypothetical protein